MAENNRVTKAAIIGAGLIGRAWAIVFARGGAQVSLYDQDARQTAAALEWCRHALQDMQHHELVADAQALLQRIVIADTVGQALAGAAHVQECIVERADAKQALFAEIETMVPHDCVLASSSSAILPSVIFGQLATRARCLVAHPMNPPHLVPIVEISGASFTSHVAIESTSHFMRLCGMSDVIVEKEIEGFILNRLQYAVLNEAFRLIEGGYVSASDLDKTLKDGLALRWSFMGPVETIDLNAPGGVADYMARYGETIRRNGELQKASAPWTDHVVTVLEQETRARLPLEKHVDAQRRRDQKLMALARHKLESDK